MGQIISGLVTNYNTQIRHLIKLFSTMLYSKKSSYIVSGNFMAGNFLAGFVLHMLYSWKLYGRNVLVGKCLGGYVKKMPRVG